MAWQCMVCNHWTGDGQKHICINDELEAAQSEIAELRKKLKVAALALNAAINIFETRLAQSNDMREVYEALNKIRGEK